MGAILERPDGRGVLSFEGDYRSLIAVERRRAVSVFISEVRIAIGVVEVDALIFEEGAVGLRFRPFDMFVDFFDSPRSESAFFSFPSPILLGFGCHSLRNSSLDILGISRCL